MGEDPLPGYRSRLTAAFEELRRRTNERRLGRTPDAFERGATWTYLLDDFPLGTPQSRLLQHFARKIAGLVWL
jgi:hypothetical protein